MAVAVCVGLVVAGTVWWGARKPETPHTGSVLAVPGRLCGGVVGRGDFLGLPSNLRVGSVFRHRVEAADQGALFDCRVGAGAQLRVEVRVRSGVPADWFWQTPAMASPMGPGLLGMGDGAYAWLVTTCPNGGAGDLVGRARLVFGDTDTVLQENTGTGHRELARLLVHTMTAVAERNRCGTVPLPEPAAIVRPSYPGLEGAPRDADPACPAGSLVAGRLWSTPDRPAPVETCRFAEAVTGDEVRFVAYRGAMASEAPSEISAFGSRDVVAVTRGTCGPDPVVWVTWRSLSAADDTARLVHERQVRYAVEGLDCVSAA